MKRFSAEKALTVTDKQRELAIQTRRNGHLPIPSSTSAKSENMGERVLASSRRRSLPVSRYPIAHSRNMRPITMAGKRKGGNTTLRKMYEPKASKSRIGPTRSSEQQRSKSRATSSRIEGCLPRNCRQSQCPVFIVNENPHHCQNVRTLPKRLSRRPWGVVS